MNRSVLKHGRAPHFFTVDCCGRRTGTSASGHWRIQDFRLGGRSSAEGAIIDAPQAPSGVGFERGVE